MCVGLPGEVISIRGTSAIVDCWGEQREVSLATLAETVLVGDFVIAHEGIAVRRIPATEIDDTIAMYEIVLQEMFVPA